MKHKTKWIFNLIMNFSFLISKIFTKNKNNNKFSEEYLEFPLTNKEIYKFFKTWEYDNDAVRGLINKVVNPYESNQLISGDCDDYAARLYGLNESQDKYLLTYFTRDLNKWHTVFLWQQDDVWHCINWYYKYKGTFEEVLLKLQKYSDSPWYDYHLAWFNGMKNKWQTVK